jgi:hypothetical protein
MAAYKIQLVCDSRAVEAAIGCLSALAERFPDAVQGFLDGLLDPSELVRFDGGDGSARPAGEFRIALQPSDRLRDFLAALPAGDVERMVVQTEGHERLDC